jgi:hypothetical protein
MKVYVIFVTREQYLFDYLEIQPDTHYYTYYTGIKNDIDRVKIKNIQNITNNVYNIDIISGKETHRLTELNRPNWTAIFNEIHNDSDGNTVGVFYCGGKFIENIVRKESMKYNNFKFHAENF